MPPRAAGFGFRPRTPGEWQHAVDTAELLLLVATARSVDLRRGIAPLIDEDKCESLLADGAFIGYTPASHDELIERVREAAGDLAFTRVRARERA